MASSDVASSIFTRPCVKALQRAFNAAPQLGEDSAYDRATDAFDAVVATTPGAAGHAALLNLRHTFLWLKPASATTPASGARNRDLSNPANAAWNPTSSSSSASTPAPAPISSSFNCRGSGRRSADFEEEESEILILEPDIKAHFVISRPTAGAYTPPLLSST